VNGENERSILGSEESARAGRADPEAPTSCSLIPASSTATASPSRLSRSDSCCCNRSSLVHTVVVHYASLLLSYKGDFGSPVDPPSTLLPDAHAPLSENRHSEAGTRMPQSIHRTVPVAFSAAPGSGMYATHAVVFYAVQTSLRRDVAVQVDIIGQAFSACCAGLLLRSRHGWKWKQGLSKAGWRSGRAIRPNSILYIVFMKWHSTHRAAQW